MRRLFFVILCYLMISQSAVADDINSAEKMIKCTLDAVLCVLHNKDLTKHSKNSMLIEIIRPLFDFSRMAKLALGKRYWTRLSKAEQERFTELFAKRLETSYCEKLMLYTDEKVIYETPVQIKKRVHIPTYLASKDNKVSILYKLYKTDKNWKIYDLEIQGVSIIRTYRSQYSEIMQRGTFDDLMRKLEESIDS
ncbi:MAG: ABC transporter substrate-binding protein [Deltaproteobacteria bacterium]|nr:ABC transporter substrate-binding protein [Deltaproteobacteria bacterium]